MYVLRTAALGDSNWWRAPAYLLDGVGPAAVLDFGRRRYALPSFGSSAIASADISSLTQNRNASEDEVFAQFTASSTSTRTRINEAGSIVADLFANQPRWSWDGSRMRLMLNNAGTNLLLNSSSLSTQSVSVTAQAYTLSHYGTGTITLSGASTAGPLVGTGTGRVTQTFTPSAGTLTLTVSGTVTNAQLETGSFATPYIPTSGSAATRLIETFRLPAAVEALLGRSAATMLVQATMIASVAGQRVVGTSGSEILMRAAAGTPTTLLLGSTSVPLSFTSALPGPFGAVLAFSGSEKAGSVNGAVVASDTNSTDSRSAVYLARGGTVDGATPYGAGYYDQLVIWPGRAANSSLPGKAVVYA